jgi:hypothetical protein
MRPHVDAPCVAKYALLSLLRHVWLCARVRGPALVLLAPDPLRPLEHVYLQVCVRSLPSCYCCSPLLTSWSSLTRAVSRQCVHRSCCHAAQLPLATQR